MNKGLDISIIIPVSERYDNISQLYSEYVKSLLETDYSYEFLYVLDGEKPKVLSDLKTLQKQSHKIKIIQLSKSFGEAIALSAGFENSASNYILTLPAYYQVTPSELSKVLRELDCQDMVIGRRWPRIDSYYNRIYTKAFHWVLNILTGSSFTDLGCRMCAFRREITKEVPIYGDQHLFFPVLAARMGFRVKEIELEQSIKDRPVRIYRPSTHLIRLLDILAIFFLIRFTKRPLRFFGLIGAGTVAVGGISLCYVIFERLMYDVQLSGRPAMLLSSLLIVLGVQILAMGLIGELIIFTHAKGIKEYTVEKIIN